MTFGETIRNLRLKRGFTLANVANKLGVSIVYVHHVERGKKGPFVPGRIMMLARHFGIDEQTLLELAAKERMDGWGVLVKSADWEEWLRSGESEEQ